MIIINFNNKVNIKLPPKAVTFTIICESTYNLNVIDLHTVFWSQKCQFSLFSKTVAKENCSHFLSFTLLKPTINAGVNF
jgi:hypothetical protein